MSYSEKDILNNLQHNYASVKYEYSNMIGCSNVGNVRKVQEDCILLLQSKYSKDFRLAAIADGMGGLKDGHIASNIIMKNIIFWFNNLTKENYYNFEKTYYDLLLNMKYFDNQLRILSPNSGTTLSLVLIFCNKTLCLSVGDSRIYFYGDKGLKQISKDNSIAWDLYIRGEIKEKDEIRFYKKNNLITSSFGDPKHRLFPTVKTILNNEYKYMLLFTDGVTDILTDKEIETIIETKEYATSVDSIIDVAMQKKQTQNYLNDKDYYKTIMGGQDNLSGIIVKNKIKRRLYE